MYNVNEIHYSILTTTADSHLVYGRAVQPILIAVSHLRNADLVRKTRKSEPTLTCSPEDWAVVVLGSATDEGCAIARVGGVVVIDERRVDLGLTDVARCTQAMQLYSDVGFLKCLMHFRG